MRVSRRDAMVGLAMAAALPGVGRHRGAFAQTTSEAEFGFGYPIGAPDRPPGEGFFIRHGFTSENTWYFPDNWHTGEDWYAIEGDTAGATVYAIADGEVVYTGGNYPGLVIIVQHEPDLFSMYGHLDFAAPVVAGDVVRRGEPIGSILARGDWVPNHLHFEVRTFLTTEIVNGSLPRYGFGCGVQCPPGPGYWPIAAPDLPVAVGWRNPTHVINRRLLPDDAASTFAAIVASAPSSASVPLRADPDDAADRVGDLPLAPGERVPLIGIDTGPETTEETTAEAYQVWYRIEAPDGTAGWVRAALPSTFETGADGRSSSVVFDLLPGS